MPWSLAYAPHLGYTSPEKPLFISSVESVDFADHVEFMAKAGFAGVLYPWASSRPPKEREAVATVLRTHRMRCSCIVTAEYENRFAPLWVDASSTGRAQVRHNIETALGSAQELGSTVLAVLLKADDDRPRASQLEAVRSNLGEMADLVARSGVQLGIEPMLVGPNMLLRTYAESVELIEQIKHPNIKLIYDTGHIETMGENPLTTLISAYEHICLIQLADMPKRVEPGAGHIDFVPILAHAIKRNFKGLVDLEFNWAIASQESERKGLEKLAALDAAALAISSQT